jgi:hypothetical protein
MYTFLIICLLCPQIGYPKYSDESPTLHYNFIWATSYACGARGSLPVLSPNFENKKRWRQNSPPTLQDSYSANFDPLKMDFQDSLADSVLAVLGPLYFWVDNGFRIQKMNLDFEKRNNWIGMDTIFWINKMWYDHILNLGSRLAHRLNFFAQRGICQLFSFAKAQSSSSFFFMVNFVWLNSVL